MLPGKYPAAVPSKEVDVAHTQVPAGETEGILAPLCTVISAWSRKEAA